MASFNKIIIVGYLGRDPELRYTPSGMQVCSFSLATTERRKDGSGEFQDHTTWFSISVWGKKAEAANQYLAKGRQVFIDGRLRQEEYTDRDGNKRTRLQVDASDFQFVGARGDDSGGGNYSPPAGRTNNPEQNQPPSGPTDDDIPF